MITELNRKDLIDYIKENKAFYSGASFDGHSDMQLLLLKVRIEIEKTNKTNRSLKS